MTWKRVCTRQAQKNTEKLPSRGLKANPQELLTLIAEDPYRKPPRFEKLVGDLFGAISCRINIQHRLVYQVLEKERVIKVLRLWTHYE